MELCAGDAFSGAACSAWLFRATVVFASSLVFPPRLMQALARRLDASPCLRLAASLKPLPRGAAPSLSLASVEWWPMSWNSTGDAPAAGDCAAGGGRAATPVYIYARRPCHPLHYSLLEEPWAGMARARAAERRAASTARATWAECAVRLKLCCALAVSPRMGPPVRRRRRTHQPNQGTEHPPMRH